MLLEAHDNAPFDINRTKQPLRLTAIDFCNVRLFITAVCTDRMSQEKPVSEELTDLLDKRLGADLTATNTFTSSNGLEFLRK